jgi:hypothetical protein
MTTRKSMVKLIFCLRRRADLTREQFLEHWSGVHAAIGVAGADELGAVRYVQNHTLTHPLNDSLQSSRHSPPAFDGVVELWFEDIGSVQRTFTDEGARRVIRDLAKDELEFVDLATSPIFVVEEHEFWNKL